jgi:hypothetical protein
MGCSGGDPKGTGSELEGGRRAWIIVIGGTIGTMAVERVTVPADLAALLRAPPPEEIARRRKVMQETLRMRDEIGPIDIPTAELLALEDDD